MKNLSLIIFLLLPYFSFAQVPDYTETDCNGITKSIYAVGDAGKPLIIASKGFDCSICMSQATTVRNFANDNLETVEVWAAMVYVYSNTESNCDAVDEWVENYNWENVFAYPDVDENWLANGTPTYYVIHPVSHAIAYQGPVFNLAKNTALNFVTVTDVADAELKLQDFTVYSDGETIRANFSSEISGVASMEVLNIVGQQTAIFNANINRGANRFTEGFSTTPGIYLFKVTLNGKTTMRKFVVTG